jgi:RNA polymerase sigma-70 factor (ECF subfamily)
MSDRNSEDLMLIERAQQGDRGALNALVRKHEVRAYQYAFRLTRNPEEAADVVSEAFVRVYNALPNFKGNSQFTTWLYRILTNCFLDHRKRESRRQTVSLEPPVTSDDQDMERQIEDVGDTPEESLLRSERGRRIEEALQKLPEYQRAMILMYHAEQLSYEEISEALDLPIGTVKSRLNRARLSLRDQLAKDEELFRVG